MITTIKMGTYAPNDGDSYSLIEEKHNPKNGDIIYDTVLEGNIFISFAVKALSNDLGGRIYAYEGDSIFKNAEKTYEVNIDSNTIFYIYKKNELVFKLEYKDRIFEVTYFDDLHF